MPKSGKTIHIRIVLLISALMLTIPSSSQPVFDHFIEKLLRKHPDRFKDIPQKKDSYDIQIIYTKIDRDRKGSPYFTTYRYGDVREKQLLPASSIKLAAAALALEKLNNLNIAGLDKHTPMLTLAERPLQEEVLTDTTAETGLPSIAHYIRKILVADDSDAFNRLYEFLGKEYFNETMHAKGYPDFRAMHRLGSPLGTEENKYTNPIRFVLNNRVIYEQQGKYSEKNYSSAAPLIKGKGAIKNDGSAEKSIGSHAKNSFDLADQQTFLQYLIFPERAPEEKKLNLTADDYRFLYQYMSQLPIETEYPSHYSELMDDASVKYLLFGKTRKRIPRQIRSFNTIGQADGYLLDNAYIADFEMGVDFLLSVSIYCNKNEIPGDSDQFNYETVGYPFMADLGKTILEYELARKRSKRPDLERFEVEYDK